MQAKINLQIDNPGKLSLHTNKGREFFLPGQIIRLEAKSNYTKIQTLYIFFSIQSNWWSL